jgi:sulfite reductase beta subunit-like hemoprotein
VRNVVGDPFAGVCEGELFDPTPYAGAFIRYFVRKTLTQLLPRKFKVSFTSTDQDVAVTGIHDLGFLPRIKNGQKGFELRTGGGTAILPRIGYTLYEFVPLTEYLKVAEAVIRIFDRQEDFALIGRGRGLSSSSTASHRRLSKMVDEELQGAWVNEGDFDPRP